jgi:hypothetical protein
MTAHKTSTRIGDAERYAAQHALQEHLNAGRLQVNEYADRSARAANATTASDLAALFTDLPAPRPKLPGPPATVLGAILRNRVLVAAVAVVLAGLVLAVSLGGRSDTPPITSAAPAPTTAPPTGAVAPRTVAPTSAPATPTGSAALPGDVTVRRTSQPGTITLRPSYGADLDDNTSPNWGVESGPNSNGNDIGLGSEGEYAYFAGDYAVVSGAPEYATCANETAYTSGAIERVSLGPGAKICVLTSEDRYALVTIISTSEQAIQFAVTVWDPPLAS